MSAAIPSNHSGKTAQNDLFGSVQSTLQHAHSIARTIPYCMTEAEKRRRVKRLLGYAVRSFK